MADRRGGKRAALVLIVDDDEPIRTALARLIRTIGYEVKAYPSGETALAQLESVEDSEYRGACVLTDIQMPGMNGLEFTSQLLLRRPSLAIAVMTAYPSLANRDLALARGALEYMTKPLDDHRLEDWLMRVVGEPGQG